MATADVVRCGIIPGHVDIKPVYAAAPKPPRAPPDLAPRSRPGWAHLGRACSIMEWEEVGKRRSKKSWVGHGRISGEEEDSLLGIRDAGQGCNEREGKWAGTFLGGEFGGRYFKYLRKTRAYY